VHTYTIKANSVAIVSDGSAVLGLGNIGPHAAIPVMEGKAQLFKEFAGIDAFPICLKTSSPDEVIAAVEAMEPVFGGINLEDIAAPACFEIEEGAQSRDSIFQYSMTTSTALRLLFWLRFVMPPGWSIVSSLI